MAVDIPFRRDFAYDYGKLEPVAPGIRRIIARNPGPFTFRGTGTYVVGEGQVAVIDPGPDLPEHVEALLMDLAGEEVTHILVTHTHRDHSPAAAAVKEATGAPTYGFGPHAGGRRGEAGVEEGGDWDFTPDIVVKDGDEIAGNGWRFEAVHTPGHTSNHLCFALPDQGILFSGDHVMGWSTSVIAPPDGDMASYMASLDKLLGRRDAVYWPTHGPAITETEGACARLHRPSARARGRHRRVPARRDRPNRCDGRAALSGAGPQSAPGRRALGAGASDRSDRPRRGRLRRAAECRVALQTNRRLSDSNAASPRPASDRRTRPR